MGLAIIDPPASPVATLEEAQLQTRSENAEESGLLQGLVAAATLQAEAFCRRRFVTQTWRLTLDAFPGARGSAPFRIGVAPGVGFPWSGMPNWYDAAALRAARHRRAVVVPYPPLVSVESVKYVDLSGALVTLDPADYLVRAAETPGEIVPAYAKSWPAARDVADAVTVEFTCGYGDPEDVPEPIRRAVLLLVGTLYANRETVAPTQMQTIPHTAEWLLGPFRVLRFAA